MMQIKALNPSWKAARVAKAVKKARDDLADKEPWKSTQADNLKAWKSAISDFDLAHPDWVKLDKNAGQVLLQLYLS
jgi:hypothetical protein